MDILNALLKNKNFSDLQQMNEEAAAEMLIIDQQYATRNLNEKTAPKCKKCGSRHWPFQNCKASTKSKGKKKKVKEAFYAHLKKLKSIREAKYVVVGNGRSYPIVALREQLRVKVGKGIAAKSVAINKLGLKEGYIVAPGFGKILRFKINESIIPDWSKDNEETQIKKLIEGEAKFDDGRVISYAGLSIRQLFERGRAGKDKEYLLKFIKSRFGGSLIERELKKLFEATEKKIASKLREADDEQEDEVDFEPLGDEKEESMIISVPDSFLSEELKNYILNDLDFNVQGAGMGSVEFIGRGNIENIKKEIALKFSERVANILDYLDSETIGERKEKLREADDEQEDEVDFEPLGDEKEEEQPFDDIPADEELPPEEELDPDPGIDEEEDEGIPKLTDKMFFGKKSDKFYYIQPAGGEEEGSKTGFEIIDAEGKVVLTSKDVEAQGEEVYDFILEAVKKLEVEMISFDIFIQFIAPKIEELKQEEEEESIGVDNTEDEFAPVEDEEPVAASVESKQLHEVKVTLDRREFDVHLLDETGGDATISISGKDFKLNNAFLTAYRKDGKITEDVLRELALDVLANIDDEQFEVLATKAKVVDKEVSDSKQIQK